MKSRLERKVEFMGHVYLLIQTDPGYDAPTGNLTYGDVSVTSCLNRPTGWVPGVPDTELTALLSTDDDAARALKEFESYELK